MDLINIKDAQNLMSGILQKKLSDANKNIKVLEEENDILKKLLALSIGNGTLVIPISYMEESCTIEMAYSKNIGGDILLKIRRKS